MRSLQIFLAIMCCLLTPSLSCGQGLVDIPDFSSVQVRPMVKAGYQRIGLNFDVPVLRGDVPVSRQDFNPLQVQLQDANVWVGSASVDLSFGPTWGLFFEASANAQKSLTVQTDQLGNVFGQRARLWTGSQFEWWALDGGASYNVYGNSGVLVGFKFDHTMLKLSDPRAVSGVPVADPQLFSYQGDIRSKLYAFFIGFKVGGPYFSATLSYAPITWVEMAVPLHAVWSNAAFTRTTFEEARYSLDKSGYMLEASGEFNTAVGYGLNLGVWGRANFARIRGGGVEDVSGRRRRNDNGAIVAQSDESQGASSVFSRYLVSAGVSAVLPF